MKKNICSMPLTHYPPISPFHGKMLLKGDDDVAKRNMVIIIIVLILVAAVVSVYQYNSTRNMTFNEAVTNHLNGSEITSIEIIRSGKDEKELTVVDPSEIEKVMAALAPIKLKKEGLSNIKFNESYWITLKTQEQQKMGITLYDKKYMSVFEHGEESNPSRTSSYQITNESDLEIIGNLFK